MKNSNPILIIILTPEVFTAASNKERTLAKPGTRLTYKFAVSRKNEEAFIDLMHSFLKSYIADPNKPLIRRFLLSKFQPAEVIDWTGCIIELNYLLARLREEQCLDVHKGQVWKMASQYFTHKGAELTHERLSRNQDFQNSMAQAKRDAIDRMIEKLTMLVNQP